MESPDRQPIKNRELQLKSINMIINLSNNIYPRTEENIRAIFLYFFPKAKNSEINQATATFYDDGEYELHYIQYYAETAAENRSFFESEFKNGATISLMMNYVINAFTKAESEWIASGPVIGITKRLKEILNKKH